MRIIIITIADHEKKCNSLSGCEWDLFITAGGQVRSGVDNVVGGVGGIFFCYFLFYVFFKGGVLL